MQGAVAPDPDEAPLLHLAPHARTLIVDPPAPYAQCANIAYPRELLERLGGFDEREPPLQGGEDTDLAQRAIEAGAAYVGAPEALTWHAVEPGSLAARLRSIPRWQHLAYVVRRHPRMRRHLFAGVFWRPSHAALPVALVALAGARRRPARAVAGLLPWALLARPRYGSSPRGRGPGRQRAARPPGRRDRRAGHGRARRRALPDAVSVNVALLSPVYWPEVRRGTERFARELADGLLARGHSPTLICGHPGLRTATTVEDGLPVVRVPRLPEGRLERRGFERHLTHVPAAVRALRREAPDVGPRALPERRAPARRAGRGETGRPLVLSYMGIPHRTALVARRGRLRLTLAAVRGAGATCVLSTTARDAFHRWLGVEARVIAPGVDLDAFTPDPAARAEDPTILCSADPGEPRKRVGLLRRRLRAGPPRAPAGPAGPRPPRAGRRRRGAPRPRRPRARWPPPTARPGSPCCRPGARPSAWSCSRRWPAGRRSSAPTARRSPR